MASILKLTFGWKLVTKKNANISLEVSNTSHWKLVTKNHVTHYPLARLELTSDEFNMLSKKSAETNPFLISNFGQGSDRGSLERLRATSKI